MGEVREPNQGTLLKEALREVLARFDFADTNLRNIAMGEVIMRMVRDQQDAAVALNFVESFAQVGALAGPMDKSKANDIIDVLRIVGFGLAGDDDALATMTKAAGQVIAKSQNPQVRGFAEVTAGQRRTDREFSAAVADLLSSCNPNGERQPPNVMAGRIAVALVQYPRGDAKLSDLEAMRGRIQKELEDRPQMASETPQDIVIRAMVAAGLVVDKKAARNVIKGGDSVLRHREHRRKRGMKRE